MSGLEPIVALGLACNILQLVELGGKTIELIKAVYRGGHPDEALGKNAATLKSLTEEMQNHTGTGRKKTEKILLEVVDKCSKAAQSLAEEVHFLSDNAKRGCLTSTLKVVSKVTWRQRRLQRLKGDLEQAEKLMQSSLLAQIWSNTNAADIELRGVRQELRFFIEQYRRGHRETTELVSIEGLKTRILVSHEAKRINNAVAEVDQKVVSLVLQGEAQEDQQARERFLNSLKYPGFNERRNQIDDPDVNSLKWVFVGDNDDKFDQENLATVKWDSLSNWLSSTDSIYWISGKPGSGKTTLLKYILAHERTRKYLDIWSSGCMIISHYFWRPGSQMQKNLQGLFFSLLYQLLSSSAAAFREVKSSISGPKDSYTDWSSGELRSALNKALDAYANGVCLFLDGLDEIDPEDGTKPGIPECLDLVFELSQKRKIKLCLASRPDPYILESSLSKYSRLRLQDLNHADLRAYATDHVSLAGSQVSARVDIVKSLLQKAQGVFLWLILATRSINEGIRNSDSTDALVERIDRLPAGLDSLYQDMWTRAGADNPSEYRQTAALYLKLVFASRDSIVPLLSLHHSSVGILDLAFATTPLADEILNTMDEPSKLVSQDVMLQECRTAAKKLNIYCVGLVEVEPAKPFDEKRAAKVSWYGRKYDSVFPLVGSSELQFIHRTASDFLTDTASGREILAFDKSSKFAIHCQLLKAWLANLTLFADFLCGFVGDWGEELRMIRRDWEYTDGWVSKDWECLVLYFEKLVNSGRFFKSATVEKILPCDSDDFLKVVAYCAFDDQIFLSRLKSGTLRSNETSEILLNLAASRWQEPSRLGTLCELLQAGADPNWQGLTQLSIQYWQVPYGILETPWQRYLLNAYHNYCSEGSWSGGASLASMAETLFLCLSKGAKLDDMVNISIRTLPQLDNAHGERDDRSIWVGDIPTALSVPEHRNNLLASIPAYTIVDHLTKTLRNCYSKSISGPRSEELLHWCQSLESECVNYQSGSVSRVLGMLKALPSESDKVEVWYETTDEDQTRLASKLMECMEGWIMSAIALDDEYRLKLTTTHSDLETMDSICNDECWTVLAQGKDNIYERLEELGIMTNVSKRHGFRSIHEWVQEYSKKINL